MNKTFIKQTSFLWDISALFDGKHCLLFSNNQLIDWLGNFDWVYRQNYLIYWLVIDIKVRKCLLKKFSQLFCINKQVLKAIIYCKKSSEIFTNFLIKENTQTISEKLWKYLMWLNMINILINKIIKNIVWYVMLLKGQ